MNCLLQLCDKQIIKKKAHRLFYRLRAISKPSTFFLKAAFFRFTPLLWAQITVITA